MNKYLRSFVNIKFEKPGKSLDLGAGKLRDVKGLRQMRWRAEGVDLKTGVNLEKPYQSPNRPFDLVVCNYVIQKLKNKDRLLKTASRNLRKGGWLFLHTFDRTDQNSNSDLTRTRLKAMLRRAGFERISARLFPLYDHEPGHKHWHKVIEIHARKK